MKNGILLMGLMLLCSCHSAQDQSNIKSRGLQIDTIAIIFKNYKYLSESSHDAFEYTMIREQKNDSILSFRYYRENELSWKYVFSITDGQFRIIQDTTDEEHLIPVDTFSIQLSGELLTIFKYEEFMPPIDGDDGYLFNKKYGLIGRSAYSWGSRLVLTNFGVVDFEKEITGILLADSVRYLRRQKIITPPPVSEQNQVINILEDTSVE
ncbi:MAG TPA: hypothetical protein VHO72_11170 [Bacteroidales bacterium]|nr:hypothetical protein [Bacteroidales bacterium]